MSSHDVTEGSVAAVDLGSNSFHMIIGRLIGDQLSIVDRLRDPVRLAWGLDEGGELEDEDLARALGTLTRYGQRLRDVAPGRVRAIGTHTFRKARQPADLLEQASGALGYPIEILSGAEEARLIYLGVTHDQGPIEGKRLVVDIGGGSTELVLGRGFTTIHGDSLQIGCVSFSTRFFPRGKITRKGFKAAELAAKLEIESLERRFRKTGWDECVGSSGTINAVGQVLRESGWSEDGALTLPAVKKLRRRLIECGSADAIDVPGLQAERRPVIAGGVAILKAVFELLHVRTMRRSGAALREGLLLDLLGRIRHEDVRDRTIRAFSERYHVDDEHAARVEATALGFLEQVADAWELDLEEGRLLLGWAARLHEIGLALRYSGYHKHGAYILANSDLPGFSRQEQDRLALLVRGHRRKLTRDVFEPLPAEWRVRLFRLCVLLRLAVRLNRTRSPRPLPPFDLSAAGDELLITAPGDWLEEHPLTRADLEDEAQVLAQCGFHLEPRPAELAAGE